MMIWKQLLCFVSILIFLVDAKPRSQDQKCGYHSCPVYDPDALNVHIVAHSHDDVGWLNTVDEYYDGEVKNIITTVVDALKQNPQRRFIQVETAYFSKWWSQQNAQIKSDVIDLINSGQLEIIGGAWSMNDEAATHYQSIIDQFTHGLKYLEDNLGPCSRPRVSWQIDPFGHSRQHASISAQLGFDSLLFARLDYRDSALRRQKKTMDLLWRGSSNLGNSSDIFTSVLYHHYNAPDRFCFDSQCSDYIDNDNCQDKVEDFADFVREQASHYQTNNILITMGDDFQYQAASHNYKNLDLLIEGFTKFPQYNTRNQPIKVYYSTPSCYTKAVNEFVNKHNYNLEIKTDDFFPYADGSETYWTGYFTSRPASKRFERLGNNLLQIAKQLSVMNQVPCNNENLTSLKNSMGVFQHHDAITGTEQQHVTDNYHFFHTKAIWNSISLVNSILSELISKGSTNDLGLTSCLLSNISYCPLTESEEFTVVVYNPLSRPVSYPVSLPVNAKSFIIIDPEGVEIKYQISPPIRSFTYATDAQPSASKVLEFIAENIPPLGYKVYRFKQVDGDDDSIKIGFDGYHDTDGIDDTSIEIDKTTGLLSAVTMNGVTLNVGQDFLYYYGDDDSGAYIFTPWEDDPQRIAKGPVKVKKIEGDVFRGVIQEFSDWSYQIIKIYNYDRSFIEFDWVIGPLDIGDLNGKEVISRFTTDLKTDGRFYTDSNGKEMLERKRNFRPTYNYTNEQPVAGNYYPVTTKIVLQDSDKEFAILTDRSQGGSSLVDGQLELMVHRALVNDDSRGVGENLDEQQYGQGIVVRGQHYLVMGPKTGNGEKSLAAIERQLALKILLKPWVLITNQYVSEHLLNLQWSAINANLPENVHLLTLEPWGKDKILIRLEHILEFDEDENLSRSVTVDLRNLFKLFTINKIQETALAGNIPLDQLNRLHWPGSQADEKLENENINELLITLKPSQIRTFVLTVKYN